MTEQVNAEEIKIWMKKMEKESVAKKRYAMLQCLFSAITSVFAAALLVIVVVGGIYYIPRVTKMMQRADYLLTETENMMQDSQTVVKNLEQISTELVEADIPGMLNEVSELTTESQKGMQEAMQKIENIDIEKMNKAISDLSAVIAPLAKLFGGR